MHELFTASRPMRRHQEPLVRPTAGDSGHLRSILLGSRNFRVSKRPCKSRLRVPPGDGRASAWHVETPYLGGPFKVQSITRYSASRISSNNRLAIASGKTACAEFTQFCCRQPLGEVCSLHTVRCVCEDLVSDVCPEAIYIPPPHIDENPLDKCRLGHRTGLALD